MTRIIFVCVVLGIVNGALLSDGTKDGTSDALPLADGTTDGTWDGTPLSEEEIDGKDNGERLSLIHI